MVLPSPILMICAGNLCRSPFAEVYMRMRFEEAGVAAECYSRGLLAMPGRKVPELALKVAQEFKQKFGRSYGLFEEYMMTDAETAIVVIAIG